MCQCPLTGNTHFYSQRKTECFFDCRCQCPLTGNTHFYEAIPDDVVITFDVSMPSNGQHSFLQLWHFLKQTILMCQCPLTGNTHFYAAKAAEAAEALERVSMPSNGQHSFLPISFIVVSIVLFLCQCPLTGNTHFYGQKISPPKK